MQVVQKAKKPQTITLKEWHTKTPEVPNNTGFLWKMKAGRAMYYYAGRRGQQLCRNTTEFLSFINFCLEGCTQAPATEGASWEYTKIRTRYHNYGKLRALLLYCAGCSQGRGSPWSQLEFKAPSSRKHQLTLKAACTHAVMWAACQIKLL